MLFSRYLVVFCLFLLFSGCAQQSVHAPRLSSDLLKEKIEYLINDPNLFNAQVGVYIESLANGEVVFTYVYKPNKHLPDGTYTFTVTDLSGTGYEYNPAANVETSDIWVK